MPIDWSLECRVVFGLCDFVGVRRWQSDGQRFSFSNNLDQDSFSALAIKLPVKDLLPGAKIQAAGR